MLTFAPKKNQTKDTEKKNIQYKKNTQDRHEENGKRYKIYQLSYFYTLTSLAYKSEIQ